MHYKQAENHCLGDSFEFYLFLLSYFAFKFYDN